MVDWDDLIRREGPAVWRTVYRLVRNRTDTDECFQETFLTALQVSQRQSVRNWPALLRRLATNRAIDRVRQCVRRGEQEGVADLAQFATVDGNPTVRAESEELAAQLRWAIAQLPERQAEAFCLHELDDWSNQQIAEQLGMTANAVGVMLHRTRQKLQELLRTRTRLSTVLPSQRPT